MSNTDETSTTTPILSNCTAGTAAAERRQKPEKDPTTVTENGTDEDGNNKDNENIVGEEEIALQLQGGPSQLLQQQSSLILNDVGSSSNNLLLNQSHHHRHYKLRDFTSALIALQKTAFQKQQQQQQETEEGNNHHNISPTYIVKAIPRKTKHCYNGCWDRYPRCCALWMRVFIPLLVLMGFAFLGGWTLANLESTNEYDVNDDIMAARKVVQTIDWNRTANLLIDLPVLCLDSFLQNTPLRNISDQLLIFDQSVGFDTGLVVPSEINNGFDGIIDVDNNITIINPYDTVEEFILALRADLIECSQSAGLVGHLIQELSRSVELQTAFSNPTFDWIRCWNETTFGPMDPYIPDQKQIFAVQNQEPFYEQVWEQDFNYWHEYYLNEYASDNLTLEVRDEAFEQALERATGRTECVSNKPGTTWFFFTVMTTVGYGNQAPITQGGRILVATFGFLSILFFAGILASTGGIVAVLYDDAVMRLDLVPLSRPLWSCLFWGVLTAIWTLYMAYEAETYWKTRLPPDEEVPTAQDSRWFAYISTTTVGLGDFYLEPEVMFVHDALIFALIFLAAFTFFAAFLTRLSDFVLGQFPDSGDVLKLRLQETRGGKSILKRIKNWLRCKKDALENGEQTGNHNGKIDNVNDDNDDDSDNEVDPFGSDDHLLELVIQYAQSPTRTLEVVERQEELLVEFLKRIKKQRIQLQYNMKEERPYKVSRQTGERDLGGLVSTSLRSNDIPEQK